MTPQGFRLTTSALTALALCAGAPALAQQQSGDQTLEQESVASGGTGLFISPSDIRTIQQQLNNSGYEAGSVDGQFAESTISALCNFQQASGLEPTGNFNPQTLSALGMTDVLSGQSSGTGQSDQTLTQEEAQGSGAPLFVSPATVRQIEQALNDSGYDAGNIDGVWDDSLRTSLANYEQAQGMEPTGTVTLSVLQALNVSLSGQGGQTDQTLAQESSAISPEECVTMGQQSVQSAMAGDGAGGMQTGGGAGGGTQTGGGTQAGGETQASGSGSQEVPQQMSQTAEGSGVQVFVSPATVRLVEQELNANGYDAGSVDGVWDDMSSTALTNFQQAQNLEPTGNLNTRVMASLGGAASQMQSLLSGGSGGGGTGGTSGGGTSGGSD